MREIACQFGEQGRLQGVVTVPTEARLSRLALVLVSAGLTAKSGPYRLYADIARGLAHRGFTVLRFDLGGVGSSQIARPDKPLQVRTEQDIRDAIDYLEASHEVTEFVVGGLCSGAEDAFRYAERDARTRGVILVDPHAYENTYWRFRGLLTRYSLNRVVYRILRTAKVINVVEDSKNRSNVEGFEGSLINYQYMDKTESTRILSALINRDAMVHYIYTAGSIDTFHHSNQFRSMFPKLNLRERVTVDFLSHIEHIQIFGEDRRTLVDAIIRRIVATYPARELLAD
jgi:pimeloyl-ACP methyl ester carboxylesterase